MPKSTQSGYSNLSPQPNLSFDPRFSKVYTRIDNGVYLINNGSSAPDIKSARDIHLNDSYALVHEYERDYLPHGFRLYTLQAMRHIFYKVCYGNRVAFRAVYQLGADELTDVNTAPAFRNIGIANAALAIILRTDGPKTITVGPGTDSPIGLAKLIRLYSKFPGYHHVPGTNKVIKLMRNNVDNEDFATIETAAATDFGRREKSGLELSVLEQNSRELKRLMALLHPINDEEVNTLLRLQETDMLSLQTSMGIYDKDFFASRTWGREHRVIFAQGMARLLEKHAGMHFGVWDDIVREESF